MNPMNGDLWGGLPDAPLGSPSPFDLLEPPLASGFLKLSRPCCYVFPSGRGDSALFAVGGFNLLVDGGSEPRSCFWKLVRHLDRVDATVLTHTGTDNLPGFASFLRRKISEAAAAAAAAEGGGGGGGGGGRDRATAPEASPSPAWSLCRSPNLLISPELGVVFYNVPEKSNNNNNNSNAAESAAAGGVTAAARDRRGSLEVSAAILESLEKLRVAPQPLFRTPAHAVEPVILFHKLGVGHLDMYVLSPVREVREGTPLGQKLPSNRAKGGSSTVGYKEGSAPTCAGGTDSVAVLVVWHPADPNERIIRVLFPGTVPQAKLLEGLEKVKHLEFLKVPVATQSEAMPGAVTAKNASLGQKAASKENVKSSSSRSSSSKRNLNREAMEKSDLNNKQSKGGEKVDKRDPLAKNKPDASSDLAKNRSSARKDGKKTELKRDPQKVDKNDAKPAGGKKEDEWKSPRPTAKAAGFSSEGGKASARAKSPRKETADMKKPLTGFHPKPREKPKGRSDASAAGGASPTSSPDDPTREFDEAKQDNLQAMMAAHKALVSEKPSDIFVSEERYVEKIIPSPVHEDYSKTPDSTDVAGSLLSPDEGITTTDVEADLDSSAQEDLASKTGAPKNERRASDKNRRNVTEAGAERAGALAQQEPNEFIDKAETEAVEKHPPKWIAGGAEAGPGRAFDTANVCPENILARGSAGSAAPGAHAHDIPAAGSAAGGSGGAADADVATSQAPEECDFPSKASVSASRAALELPGLGAAAPRDGAARAEAERGATERGATERGATERGATERGATERGATERGATERGATERGATERGATERGATERGATERGATERGALRAPTSILHRSKTPSCERSVIFDLTPLEIKVTVNETHSGKECQGSEMGGEGDVTADADTPTRSPPSSAGHTPYNLSPVDDHSFLFEEAAAARRQEQEEQGPEEAEPHSGCRGADQSSDGREPALARSPGAAGTFLNEIKDIANTEVIHAADAETFTRTPLPDDESKVRGRPLADEVLRSLGVPGDASDGSSRAAQVGGEHPRHRGVNEAAAAAAATELAAARELKISAAEPPPPVSATPTEDGFLRAREAVSTASIAAGSFLNEATDGGAPPSLAVDVGSPQSTEVDESLSTSVEKPPVGRAEASGPTSASADAVASPARADEASATMASDRVKQKQHGSLASAVASQLHKRDDSGSSSSSPARAGGDRSTAENKQSEDQAAQSIGVSLPCDEDRQKCVEASATAACDGAAGAAGASAAAAAGAAGAAGAAAGGDLSVTASGHLLHATCGLGPAVPTPVGQPFPASARSEDPTPASSWAARPRSSGVEVDSPSTSVNDSSVSSSDSAGRAELGRDRAVAAKDECPLAGGPEASAGAGAAGGPAARAQVVATAAATAAPVVPSVLASAREPRPAGPSAHHKPDPAPPAPDPAVRMVDPELAHYGQAIGKVRGGGIGGGAGGGGAGGGGAATKRDPQSVKAQKQPRVKTPSPGSNPKSLGKATTPPGRSSAGKKSPGDSKTTAGIKKKGGAGCAALPGAAVVRPLYVDLAYIPSHGARGKVGADFFTLVRATHYVLSGDDAGAAAPDRATLDALLAGRAEWGVNHTVTLIPTCDTAAVRCWYQETHERQRELGVMVLASSSTVVMQSESFPACKIEF